MSPTEPRDADAYLVEWDPSCSSLHRHELFAKLAVEDLEGARLVPLYRRPTASEEAIEAAAREIVEYLGGDNREKVVPSMIANVTHMIRSHFGASE